LAAKKLKNPQRLKAGPKPAFPCASSRLLAANGSTALSPKLKANLQRGNWLYPHHNLPRKNSKARQKTRLSLRILAPLCGQWIDRLKLKA
jgi:hypothetical protein